jgi:hypothetical protein
VTVSAAFQHARQTLIELRNTAIVQRALKRAGQTLCLHADRVIYTGDRIFVKCDRCQRETPGTALGEIPETRRS